jgi:dTDP-glucose 4,6-dehydratase
MRILITGGCGFLGHHIVEHLLKTTDAEIVILDKLSYASNGFQRLRDIEAYDDKRVHVLGCDLAQPIPEGITAEVGEIEYIIHAAAETHVDNSIVDPMPFLQSNVMGTHHLLWWARSLQSLQHIFLVSTDEVYGPAAFGDDVAGFDEEAAFRPANPYAAAKAGGECVAMAYANTYKLPLTIVNTMNLIGERQHHEKFVPMVIRRVLMGQLVTIHADATKRVSGTRFYLHARTFAHALAYLLGATGRRMPLKVHVCGEREISNLDLAELIASYVGKPLLYQMVDFHTSRPGHDLRYCMQDQLIQDLGWKRPMMLEQSLKKTVAWYLAHPRWLGILKTFRADEETT